MLQAVSNKNLQQSDSKSAQTYFTNDPKMFNSPVNNDVQRYHKEEINRDNQVSYSKLNSYKSLDESLENAYQKAVNFANKVLLDDDMHMSLEENSDKEIRAVVKNIRTDETVQNYSALQVLQMYSSNYDLKGIVVDTVV